MGFGPFTSGYTWPNQGQPTQKDWNLWPIGLWTAFPANSLRRLLHPVGNWLQTWDKGPLNGTGYILPHTNILYQSDDRVVLPQTNRATSDTAVQIPIKSTIPTVATPQQTLHSTGNRL